MLIGLDGHVKLADFGSAKMMLGRNGTQPPPPVQHSLKGTPDFMAPETLLAEPACEDADKWAVGVLTVDA